MSCSDREITNVRNIHQELMLIGKSLPPDDGIQYFNQMYIEVACGIAGARSTFNDQAAIDYLNLTFVDLYYKALSLAKVDPLKIPRSWAPLLEARNNDDILPLQFFLAGMNAHINHDLVIALMKTWTECKIEPHHNTPFYEDFERVNDVLATIAERFKDQFMPKHFKRVGEFAENITDLIAMWNVRAAREAA